MYSKLLFAVLCLSFIKNSFVYGDVILEDKSNIKNWIVGLIDFSTLHPDADCKRFINHTSILKLEILHNLPVNCSYIIGAGLNERAHVDVVHYDFTPLKGITSRPKNYPYDDALNLNIYDGDQVNESKHLFRLGDEKLENVTSTGRYLFITADFKKSDVYKSQYIDLQISYLPK